MTQVTALHFRYNLLDKAKPARRLLVPVQSHDYTLDLAALGKELKDLLLGCIKGQIADVECCRLSQALLLLFIGALKSTA